MENKLPDSFCWAPYVNADLNQDGHFYPCYRSKVRQGEWKDGGLVTAYNNESMQTLRDDLWNGRENANCIQCHRREAEGVESTRQQYNKYFTEDVVENLDIIDTIAENHKIADVSKIHTMEIRPHGMCTNACAHCDENSSSRWIRFQGLDTKEFTKNYEDKPEVLNEFFDQATSLKTVHFTGGEPLLYPKTHVETLKKLPKNIELRYHSSLKEEVHEDIIEQWQEFDKVKLFVSLDTSVKYFHWFRYGSNWNTVIDNVKAIQDIIEVNAVITVNILTMLDLHRLVKDIVDLEIPFNVAFVDPPHQLSCVFLSQEQKKYANMQIDKAKIEVTRYKEQWMKNRCADRLDKMRQFMHTHYDKGPMHIETLKLIRQLDGIYNLNLGNIDSQFSTKRLDAKPRVRKK